MVSFTWLPAAIPVLAAGVKVASSLANRSTAHRVEVNLKRHVALLKELPEDVDKTPLQSLIDQELNAVKVRGEDLMYRRVDKENVAIMVIVLAVATGMVIPLWTLDLQSRGWEIFWRIVAVAIGIFGFGLATIGGLASFWRDSRNQDEKPRS